MLYTISYVLLIPAMILCLVAQMRVRSTFNKYSKVGNMRGITGAQAAYGIMRDQNIDAVLEHTQGTLSDHYDPRTNTLRLSNGVYNEASVAALGVAAHEVGHLMQQQEGYFPMRLRTAVLPLAQLGSTLAMPLVFIGLFLEAMSLVNIGILLFSAVVLFQLVTLPVEFNASRRALLALEQGGYSAPDEIPRCKKVLSAAALTYVASVLVSMLQLLRFIGLSRRR